MKFIQHIPGFVDTDKPPHEFEFNTVDELLSDQWIKSWSRYPDFFKFSFSKGKLMAEYDGGRKFYVLGYINDYPPDLPEWKHHLDLPQWKCPPPTLEEEARRDAQTEQIKGFVEAYGH